VRHGSVPRCFLVIDQRNHWLALCGFPRADLVNRLLHKLGIIDWRDGLLALGYRLFFSQSRQSDLPYFFFMLAARLALTALPH